MRWSSLYIVVVINPSVGLILVCLKSNKGIGYTVGLDLSGGKCG